MFDTLMIDAHNMLADTFLLGCNLPLPLIVACARPTTGDTSFPNRELFLLLCFQPPAMSGRA